MSQEEVEAEVAQLSASKQALCKLVEITGGEPMLQERELIPFMEKLLADGYTVLIETSGERPLANVPKAVHKIVDVKCPQSGEGGSFNSANLSTLTNRDEVKLVLAGREDYEFARSFIQQHELEKKCGQILLSPAFSKNAGLERTADNCMLDPQTLTDWMLEDGLPARLSLQIHKFIWPPQQKGV